MSAYVIFEMQIHDPEAYERYVEAAAPMVELLSS